MANTIILKNKTTSGAPGVGDLALGELAVNSFDGKLFLKKDNGTPSIVEVGGASSGIQPAFSVHRNGTNQTGLSNGVATKILFTTEVFDTNNNFDTTTSRFTPTVAGKYLITASARLNSASDQSTQVLAVYKNGASYCLGVGVQSGATATTSAHVQTILDMNGSTDYVEIYTSQDTGSTRDLLGLAAHTFATGMKL